MLLFLFFVFGFARFEYNSTHSPAFLNHWSKTLWTFWSKLHKSMNFPGCGRSRNYYCPCVSSRHNYLSLFSIPLNALLISMTWYVPKRRFENERSSHLRGSLSVHLFSLALYVNHCRKVSLWGSHFFLIIIFFTISQKTISLLDLNFYLFSRTIHPYVSFLFSSSSSPPTSHLP